MDLRASWLPGALAVFAVGAGVGYFLAPRESRSGPEPIWPQRAEMPPARFIGADEGTAARLAAREEESETPRSLADRLVVAARQRDFFERRWATAEIARGLDSDGLAQAMAAANELSVADRDWVQPTLLARWVEVDPASALEWVRALPMRAQRRFLLREGFEALGLKDPTAALRFMADHQSRGGDEDVVDWVFDGWAQHDPRAAVQAAAALADEKNREDALQAALRKWAVQEPESALAWLRTQPPSEDADARITTVFFLWAEQDPASAGGWLNTLPAGKVRDHAAGRFAKTIVENDPEAAFTWAASIADPKLRETSVRQAFSQWVRRDKAAALVWLQRAPMLSEATRAELLRRAQ